jgi:hypothetical protein
MGPSLPAGWREYSVSVFHVALPDRWEAVDVGQDGIEAILNSLDGTNSEWAEDATAMLSAGAMQQMVEFWARDSEPAGIGYATASITYQTQPFPIPIDILCALMPSFSEQMGFEVVEVECGLKINDLDAARFVTSLQMGSMPAKQYLYTYVRAGDLWTLSLTVDEADWSRYEPTFAAIAETFRLD